MKSPFNPARFNITQDTWNTAIRFKNDDAVEELQSIIEQNYPVVKDHYKDKRGSIVSDKDLDDICIAILWHWIRAAELGQTPNGKEMNKVLKEKRKDFDHYAKEIIVNLMRARYPDHYAKPSAFLLDISEKEITDYVAWQEMMYNK